MSAADTSRDMVFEVVTGSHVMGIKPLLNLCSLKITFLIRNKSLAEVHIIMHVYLVYMLVA
jgi:hypothetical protein